MAKRAAIYIRTSTERQAEKVSPEAQEADCRKLCAERGHSVVEIYKDTEKYRVRGRMVEPSGTRYDRPQFTRMLKDFDNGDFDVLVAWRADRLYRGVNRAVVEVKERVKQQGLEIEVVNGGFEVGTMEVLAWAAGVENEARRERTQMGIDARLRSGRLYLSNCPYGYTYDPENGILVVNEEEAKWVRLIWEWFGRGVGKGEIRRRLIESGVPQKQFANKKRLYPWSLPVIGHILRKDYYHTGIWTRTMGKGKQKQVYEFAIPSIIDAHTFQAVRTRSAQWKLHPVGNWKQDTGLLSGKVYCACCGVKMGLIKKFSRGKRHDYYHCNNKKRRISHPECAKRVRVDHIDPAVWIVVWSYITDPHRFAVAVVEQTLKLYPEDGDVSKDIARIERQLEDMALERQRVIAWARKGVITDDDLAGQLLPLTEQERQLRRDLQERRSVVGTDFESVKRMVRTLAENLSNDLDALHWDSVPTDEDEARRQFAAKRKYIDTLVQRVTVEQDKSIIIDLGIVIRDGIAIPIPDSEHRISEELAISSTQP